MHERAIRFDRASGSAYVFFFSFGSWTTRSLILFKLYFVAYKKIKCVVNRVNMCSVREFQYLADQQAMTIRKIKEEKNNFEPLSLLVSGWKCVGIEKGNRRINRKKYFFLYRMPRKGNLIQSFSETKTHNYKNIISCILFPLNLLFLVIFFLFNRILDYISRYLMWEKCEHFFSIKCLRRTNETLWYTRYHP